MKPTDPSDVALALTGSLEWHAFGSDEVQALAEAAVEQGVDALLWERLAGVSGDAPRALRHALTTRVRAAATRDIFIQRDLQDALRSMAEAGVVALVTKGTALAYTVYPQPWLRPRTDSDLLVRHADVPAAGRALEACGYSRSDALSTGELVSHQVAFERTDAHGVHHVIDLHWKIVNPQIVADALTYDRLRADAQAAPALGDAALVPSVIASIALGCVHRLAHHQGQDRLIWLYDLDLLAGTLTAGDWVALRDLACGQRIAGFCLDGLRTARACFGTRIPEQVESALAAAAPSEPSHAYLAGPLSKRDVLLSDLSTLDNWGDRLRLVREHAFPPPAFMRQRYGANARWPLPVLYVHRILTGASKWVRS